MSQRSYLTSLKLGYGLIDALNKQGYNRGFFSKDLMED